MKIVTWNVNSIRQRVGRTAALLERHEPDVVCLQETKTADETFPREVFERAGYTWRAFGQRGRNGVAIVSRESPDAVERGFPGDPVPDEARLMSATVSGIRFVNVYVVNGKFVGAPAYELKLRWLEALLDWLALEYSPSDPLLVLGDFNVAPEDRDVHDPKGWRGKNLCSEPERDRVRALIEWGLVDLLRLHHDGPGPYTWWDYRAGAFHRGWGLRLDLVLGTRVAAERCRAVVVDRDERKPTFGEGTPSDHVPVIAALG